MSVAAALGILVLGLLTTARLTRVLTDDRIGAPIRSAVVGRLGAEHALSYLVHCRWCTSMWIAVPAALLVSLLLVDGWTVPALALPLALAYSHLTGLLVALEPED